MKRPRLVIIVALVCVAAMLGVSNVEAQSPSDINKIQAQLNQIQQSLKALQSAVDQIPPAWAKIIPGAPRFVLVLNGEAVLDRETGLVWERIPSAGTTHYTWFNALGYCSCLSVGNRMGWRLPTVQELASLIDHSVSTYLKLPNNHPFEGVQPTYLSATVHVMPGPPEWYEIVRMVSIGGDGAVGNTSKDGIGYVWCVRGGPGEDAQGLK